ncbi:MAG: glycerol-3-phosphate 1-O-acyltransferase PlsY [Deltaproteobacteria bacterium]|nr:glycerol-3-phosphate 1-O-acyltransferase PlsY [Deltaproteobacteria bacterium]
MWHAAWAGFFVVSYLLGSIPFGRLIAQRVARIDITRRGSGNIGATNVARELGVKWGLVTLLLDLLKGLAPTLAFRALFPGQDTALSIVGVCALLGHQFTPFLRFRGGKGVATALGVYLAISPLSCLGALVVFVLVVSVWDFISLGSMAGAAAMPLFLALASVPAVIVLASAFMACFIFLKHKENIRRLLAGNERKWRKRG